MPFRIRQSVPAAQPLAGRPWETAYPDALNSQVIDEDNTAGKGEAPDESENGVTGQIAGTGTDSYDRVEEEASEPMEEDAVPAEDISASEEESAAAEKNSTSEEKKAEAEEETSTPTAVFELDADGKIQTSELRQYLQTDVTLLEQNEKLPFDGLLSHIPAAAVALVGTVAVLALLEAVFLARRGKHKDEGNPKSDQKPETGADDAKKDHANSAKASKAGYAGLLLVGSLHNIGKRSSQQDSLEIVRLQEGLFAVVADGMGGLADGDRVSQQIVRTMRADAEGNGLAQLSGNLNRMVAHANADVNRLLGYPEQYVSGSTLVAVLAERKQFQWISVGDSRIYLYRQGALLQLNREHVFERELLNGAVNGEVSFQEAHSHAKKKSVSSFIGMGRLKYIDEPLRPVSVLPGDRVLLTSDGLFNTLSDEEIAEIIRSNPDPTIAARELENAVLKRGNQYQDNFTSVLIAW